MEKSFNAKKERPYLVSIRKDKKEVKRIYVIARNREVVASKLKREIKGEGMSYHIYK